MTTLTTPSPVLAAAAAHHDSLLTDLSRLTEAFITAVTEGPASQLQRAALVAFLHAELLPHAESEDALLYTAVRTPRTALLTRAMQDEHRMMRALVDEVEHAGSPMDAAVAASALVVLSEVRIAQENEHLLPSLEAAGLDLSRLLDGHPEITGDDDLAEPADGPSVADDAAARGRADGTIDGRRSVDLTGLDYYNRRHRMFTALQALAPGEEALLVSECGNDVSTWLRYEMEARLPQRYEWSSPQQEQGLTRTRVRCPEH
ncbi:hypothetical protein FOE78_13975 [Microlunatus elymi]|uniref:Hemerythrin-like domain-containing protein n=1 Tax=Microlunatus elymi TaxID=2596828 RepID=A0A516Q0A7_9ACTN|nr:hemerythrin domain-containing protein [Microlunatus elymi]QDP96875.1 hypothetical protein FOE78_13975 [Microlunatus elymi]